MLFAGNIGTGAAFTSKWPAVTISDSADATGNQGATWNYGANFGGSFNSDNSDWVSGADTQHGGGVGMFGGFGVDYEYPIILCPGQADSVCKGRRRHFLRNYRQHHRTVMAYNAADVEEKKTLRVSLKASQQKLQKEYDSFKQFLKPVVNLRGKNPKGLQMSNGFEYSPENKAKVIEVLHVFKNYPEFQRRLWRCKEWPEHKSLCKKLEKNFFDQVHKIVNVSQDEEKYQVELERGVELYKKIDYTVLGMSP